VDDHALAVRGWPRFRKSAWGLTGLLKGEYKGLHSIRINDQWRIVFRWRDGHADAVRVMDYH
jgi:plasmid maintenance system killer protein